MENNISEKTDDELVELAKQDPDQFGILMGRYQEKLFWYVKRISFFSGEDIEDILQEVFIRIYKNLNNYKPSIKFSSWIYRITHNYAVDVIRKKSTRMETLLSENETMDFVRSSVNIEKEFLSKECLEKVEKVIKRLPLKYKEILVLRFLEEKDYEEIMDILRKPKGSVATLINRGRKELKKELEKSGIKCFE